MTLSSYSSHIGRETMRRVKASPVGVMMAARMRMATMAWRRYWVIHSAFSSPKRANSQLMTGISKTIPNTKLIISSVSMYDCRVSILRTSPLTW